MFIDDAEKLIDPKLKQMIIDNGTMDQFIDSINCNQATYYEDSDKGKVAYLHCLKYNLDLVYYFLNVFKNKKDLSYARGSIFKAMSVASKYPFVLKQPFDDQLDHALNEYFELINSGSHGSNEPYE